MFLDPKILRKLLKQAYKTGLIVAREDNRIYLSGGYWEAEILKDYIPKETMGDLISLIGELPEEGTRISATKEGNQYEIEMPMGIQVEAEDEELEISNCLLLGCGGVVQRLLQDTSGKVYACSNVYISIINNGWVEESKGEYVVINPYRANNGLMWQNNVCKFHAYFRNDTINESFMKNIQGIDIVTNFLPEEEQE